MHFQNSVKHCSVIEDRFSEPEVMFAFRICGAKKIPLDDNLRMLHANHDHSLMIARFNVASAEQTLKVVNGYQT